MVSHDLAAVVAIEQRVQTHPWSHLQFVQSLQQHQCTVIDIEHQVVGFCIMQPVLDEANLLLMAIDPKWQGRGLGSHLLEAALERLVGCEQVFLEVRESNHAAIKLYEKLGFHQIAQRRGYYPRLEGGSEDAIIMVKMINVFQFTH